MKCWNADQVKDGEVLVASWMDSNAVSFMTTVHGVKNPQCDYVFSLRRRPKDTSSNAAVTQAPFEGEPRKLLPIPKFANDYNHLMNGVESFGQRRAAYDARLISRKNWWSLYQFLLDIALINTIAIMRFNGSKELTFNLRMDIVNGLHEESETVTGDSQPNSVRSHYVSRSVTHLPPSRLIGKHTQFSVLKGNERRTCFLCSFVSPRGSSSSKRKGTLHCETCNKTFCAVPGRNCFSTFHDSSYNPSRPGEE